MKSLFAACVAGSTLLALSGLAHAGARPPDEGFGSYGGVDMRGMSDDQLRRRIQDACIYRLSEQEKTIRNNAVGRCGCYAGNIMKAMSKEEADTLRSSGAFARSARPKAENALKVCKV